MVLNRPCQKGLIGLTAKHVVINIYSTVNGRYRFTALINGMVIVAMAYHLQYTEDDICHYLLPIVYINLTKKKPYSHDSTWCAQTHKFDPVSARDVLSGAFFYSTTHKNRLNSFDMPFRG